MSAQCLHNKLEEQRMTFHNLQAYELLENRPLDDIHSEGLILRHKKAEPELP